MQSLELTRREEMHGVGDPPLGLLTTRLPALIGSHCCSMRVSTLDRQYAAACSVAGVIAKQRPLMAATASRASRRNALPRGMVLLNDGGVKGCPQSKAVQRALVRWATRGRHDEVMWRLR